MEKKKITHEKTIAYIIFFLFLITIIFSYTIIQTARVEIDCSTGDIDFNMVFNQSLDPVQLNITGVDDMRCSIKVPVYAMGGLI